MLGAPSAGYPAAPSIRCWMRWPLDLFLALRKVPGPGFVLGGQLGVDRPLSLKLGAQILHLPPELFLFRPLCFQLLSVRALSSSMHCRTSRRSNPPKTDFLNLSPYSIRILPFVKPRGVIRQTGQTRASRPPRREKATVGRIPCSRLSFRRRTLDFIITSPSSPLARAERLFSPYLPESPRFSGKLLRTWRISHFSATFSAPSSSPSSSKSFPTAWTRSRPGNSGTSRPRRNRA